MNKTQLKKKMDNLYLCFALLWIASWFAAIWVDGYHLKLFFTGLFMLFWALVTRAYIREQLEEKL